MQPTLTSEGSYQVEMTDEGVMADDIEEYFQVVLKALRKCNLQADDVIAWCAAMTKNDRVGLLSDTELQALRKQIESKTIASILRVSHCHRNPATPKLPKNAAQDPQRGVDDVQPSNGGKGA